MPTDDTLLDVDALRAIKDLTKEVLITIASYLTPEGLPILFAAVLKAAGLPEVGECFTCGCGVASCNLRYKVLGYAFDVHRPSPGDKLRCWYEEISDDPEERIYASMPLEEIAAIWSDEERRVPRVLPRAEEDNLDLPLPGLEENKNDVSPSGLCPRCHNWHSPIFPCCTSIVSSHSCD